MQAIILSNLKLTQIISEMKNKPYGEIKFCEDMEIDYIDWEDLSLNFDEIIPMLNDNFKIEIKNYEACEINDVEFGFAFFF